jgi:penicillin-binding protein 2
MSHESEASDIKGQLIEQHLGFDPRIISFYGFIGILLLLLIGGSAYRQLVKSDSYGQSEHAQTERRVLIPGPRGNIYDRYGRVLVSNEARFSVVLYLDELQQDFRSESIRIRNNYRALGDKELPTMSEMEQIAHVTVAQHYLDIVNHVLGRHATINAKDLTKHFNRMLYMPYTLIDGLSREDFVKLLENIPVGSPIQLYTANERYYPYGTAAAHVLGYVGYGDNAIDDDQPGEDLKTFAMRGTIGKAGLEKQFDNLLQGSTGGSIFRVDPAGYKVNPPLEHHTPAQGENLVTSLDIDLQRTAEEAIGDQIGSAVAIDVNTGEVLVLAEKPSYDLNQFSPKLSQSYADEISKNQAWINVAIGEGGTGYPPGSTFKTLVTIAGLRRGTLDPNDRSIDCEGYVRIGNSLKSCDNGIGHHGSLKLSEAIAQSCDIYFYEHGMQIGASAIADEARRFGLDKPTGIELPSERKKMLIPDPAWKERTRGESWTSGDTANMAIGQGDIIVTPLAMACYAASLARNELSTKPTLIHKADRPIQHSEPIGLTEEQRAVLIEGMEGCTKKGGTASILSNIDELKTPGVQIAGKTGTAQYGNHLNVAWFICFAPSVNPKIAMAVAIRSEKPGENYAGGIYAAPIAATVIKKYFEKLNASAQNQMSVSSIR